jgi:hypothetical protein
MALNVVLDVSFDNIWYWGGMVEKAREGKEREGLHNRRRGVLFNSNGPYATYNSKYLCNVGTILYYE